jgi:hypothetical protein
MELLILHGLMKGDSLACHSIALHTTGCFTALLP